jgi:pimeloyl-ACP methyl ester carboxylesterase
MPFLIIHPLSGSSLTMVELLEPIFKKSKLNFERIYVDLPGHGNSQPSSIFPSTDEIFKNLEEFIDTVIGKKLFCVAGFSYGAYFILGLLKKRLGQIQGFLMIAPVINTDDSTRIIPESRGLIYCDHDYLNTIPYKEQQMISSSKVHVKFTKEIHEKFLEIDKIDSKKADENFITELRTKNYSSLLFAEFNFSEFHKPALIISGKQDSVVGYEEAWYFSQHFSRCSFVALDSAGHWVSIEQKVILEILVLDLLDRISNADGFNILYSGDDLI